MIRLSDVANLKSISCASTVLWALSSGGVLAQSPRPEAPLLCVDSGSPCGELSIPGLEFQNIPWHNGSGAWGPRGYKSLIFRSGA